MVQMVVADSKGEFFDLFHHLVKEFPDFENIIKNGFDDEKISEILRLYGQLCMTWNTFQDITKKMVNDKEITLDKAKLFEDAFKYLATSLPK